MVQDYTSSSIGKRTQKLAYSYTFNPWEVYGENIRSSSAGEYSLGLRYTRGNWVVGGDGRLIVGQNYVNNSGLTLNYRGKVLKLTGEIRPLLRYGEVRLTPYITLRKQTLGLTSSYERAHYRLPSYSEDLITYEVSPYLKGGVWEAIGYALDVGYSGREYPLTPMKSYTTYRLHGRIEVSVPQPLITHNLKVEGRLSRYNYVGLRDTSIPVGVEERSVFEYNPLVLGIFKLNLSAHRTLSVYTGVLRNRSKVYRDILVGGEMVLKGTNVYLKRRREDHVLLHRSRSSDTRTLVRYVLGAYRTLPGITLGSEISAIYTLYRFKPEDNSLYRYLDGEISYEGRSEFSFRIRMWDRGRYVSDSAVYYRLTRGLDIYTSGWIPIVRIGDVDIGASYDIKPEGEAVGVRSVFVGGEVLAMRRYENEHLFWQVSLKFSRSF